jgi:hypothetical protein
MMNERDDFAGFCLRSNHTAGTQICQVQPFAPPLPGACVGIGDCRSGSRVSITSEQNGKSTIKMAYGFSVSHFYSG